jgi:outer membrane protein assembly factor BamB
VGPRATASFDGGKIFTVGLTGILTCLDAETGKLAWPRQIDLLREFSASMPVWAVSCSPLIEGDLLIVQPGGPRNNGLVAFNKNSAEVVWKSLDEPGGYSSPIAITAQGTRQIVIFTNKNLVSVSAKDGNELWRFPWETSYGVNARTPLFFRAQIGKETGEYIFISTGYGKGCALLKIVKSEAGQWSAEPVYQSNLMRNHFNNSVRLGNFLYGIDYKTLRCLDVSTGKKKWSQSGFQMGSLILADGCLIILGETGELALAEATPDEFRLLASTNFFQDNGKRCFTPPTLAQGRLYLRDQKEVVCLEFKKR